MRQRKEKGKKRREEKMEIISSSSLVQQIVVILLVTINLIGAWSPSPQHRQQIKYDEKRATFFGNVTDYFKVLDQDDNSMLIGAK